MSEEAAALIEAARGRWMTGAPAATAAGPAWRPLLEDVDPLEAELRLVAIVGQALETSLRPTPPENLATRADLPLLDLPPLEDSLRPRFRRLLKAARDSQRLRALFAFLAARGRTAHPRDWTPAVADPRTPAVYGPWASWAAGIVEAARPTLDAESWTSFEPAERQARLVEMRRRDPAKARELIAACAGSEPSERRHKLVEILSDRLSEADAPHLESLARDERAPNIRALAASLLARLGRGGSVSAEAEELAGYLEHRPSGLLKRARIFARPLKTEGQRNMRLSLFEALTLNDLSRALGTPPAETLAAWDFDGDYRASHAFVKMAARTASDGDLAVFAKRLTIGPDADPELVELVAPRLSASMRADAAGRIIASSKGGLERAAAASGDSLGAVGKKLLLGSPAVADLRKALSDTSKTAKRGQAAIEADLFYLGVLANGQAAASLLDVAAEAGMLLADPRLDMLHLNVALAATAPEGREPA